MKAIVVYESKTGFTAQYAQWIAEELNCTCIPLKQAEKENLGDYDRVIFGGWIMGNIIFGLNKLLSMQPCPAAVFAVGATPAYEEVIQEIKKVNNIKDIPFFYMQGGMHFNRIGFFPRLILKVLKKSTAKKEVRNRQEEFMAQALATTFDSSGKEQTEALLAHVRGDSANSTQK